MTTHPKRDHVLDLLRRYPKRPTLQLARIAKREKPILWDSVETARSSIRYARGNHGSHNRRYLGNRTFMRSNQKPHNPWAAIPPGESDLDWQPLELPGNTILSLSDIHTPWHDNDALLPALDTGLKAGVDCVLLLGDFCDIYELSDFDRDPMREKLLMALQSAWTILKAIRLAMPRAKIVWKFGNHEERWERFFWRKGPELCGLEIAKLSFVFQNPQAIGIEDKADLGLQFVDTRTPCRVGHLWLWHGHEFGRNRVFSPVNAARGYFLKAMECGLGAHQHQTSEHSMTTIGGKQIRVWSQGCLCRLRPHYSPINPGWNHGFALVRRLEDDNFEVQNKIVLKGKVY